MVEDWLGVGSIGRQGESLLDSIVIAGVPTAGVAVARVRAGIEGVAVPGWSGR
jgi:hypothetical protein